MSLEQWIKKYFPEDKMNEAQKILSDYGAESWHREPERVKRDAVIISRGSLAKLRETVDLARRDYRDVLIGEEVDPWVIDELKKAPQR